MRASRRGNRFSEASNAARRWTIGEILVSDPGIRSAIAHKAPAEDLRRLAMAGGMTTLAQDGIAKCLAGTTDIRQVLSACTR